MLFVVCSKILKIKVFKKLDHVLYKFGQVSYQIKKHTSD